MRGKSRAMTLRCYPIVRLGSHYVSSRKLGLGDVEILFFVEDNKQIIGDSDENFERLLKILGQKIELQGWGNYRGGLDTIC